MTSKNDKAETDPVKTRYGFYIVLTGLAIVIVAYLAAIAKWTTASDVSTAVGSVTTVVGTLVGAFFGIKEGEAGKDKAEKQRAKAEETAIEFAGALGNADKAREILERLRR